MRADWITWRKLNTVRTTYVSKYPAEVWKITRVPAHPRAPRLGGWTVSRAANDGDEYKELTRVMTLAEGKTYANNWTPEEVSTNQEESK